MKSTPVEGLKAELVRPDHKEVRNFLDEGIGGDETHMKSENATISRGSSEPNTAITTVSSGFESMDSGVWMVKYKDDGGKEKSLDGMKKRRFKKSSLIAENPTSLSDSWGRKDLFSHNHGPYLGSDSNSTASESGFSSRNHSHNVSSISDNYRSLEGILQNNSSSFFQVSNTEPHRSHKKCHGKDEKVILVTSVNRNNSQGFPKSKRGRKLHKKNTEIQSQHYKIETKAPVSQEVLTATTVTSNFVTAYKSGNHRSKHQSSKDRSWLTPEELIRRYGSSLTDYERTESLQYKKIYYFGLGAEKPKGRNESYNSGFDSKKGEYKTVEHDHIAYRYEVLGSIGQGAFGEVVSAYDHKKHRKVALKIVRNRPNLHEQSRMEVRALKALKKHDPNSKNFTLRIFDNFTFRNHPCIVFELIGDNLYEVLKQRNFEGLPLKTIRRVAKCVLKCLAILSEESIIHCDVKPENILLVPGDKAHVKLIDFGSSCRESEQIYNYIQSRYYRAPEVIMGMRYTASIDMWSLGCVLAELYTGVPIFPGSDEANQLQCIANLMGEPPVQMTSKSSIFAKLSDGKKVRFALATSSEKNFDNEMGPADPLFKDFVRKCLAWNPEDRLTVKEALKHPWIKNGKSLKNTTEATKKTTLHTQRDEPPINFKDLHISSPSDKRLERQGGGVNFEWLQPVDLKIPNNPYEKTAVC